MKQIHRILNSTREAIFILDKCGNIKVYNDSARKIIRDFTGTDIKKVSNLVEAVPEWRRNAVTSIIAGAVAGKSFEYEVHYPSAKWIKTTIYTNIQQEDGSNDLCCTLKDITVRKKAEEVIRISEQRYHTLFESMMEGVIFQSLEKNKSTANSSAASILGISQKALHRDGLQSPMLKWVNEKGEPVSIHEIFCADLKLRRAMQGVVLGFYKGFELSWLSINAEPINKGVKAAEEGCVFTFTDITESVKYRHELALLSKVMKETSNIVVITDRKERIVWANDSFTRTSEYTLDEATGRRPGELLKGPEKDPAESGKIRDALKNGRSVQGEILNYSKSGKKYWTNYNIQPVRDSGGDVTKFFSIQSDITELKRIREEFTKREIEHHQQIIRAALQAQEEKQIQIGQELHDNINQILAVAQLYTSMLTKSPKDLPSQMKQIREHINLAITEIRKLSHQLVAPQFGKESISETFEPLLKADNYGFCLNTFFDVKDESQIVPDQKLALYRIAQEQMNNIHKHAKANVVTITITQQGEELVMVIEDDGIGFDTSGSRHGIGITNIMNRCESLNGKADIWSAPGQGCRLIVSIPLFACKDSFLATGVNN